MRNTGRRAFWMLAHAAAVGVALGVVGCAGKTSPSGPGDSDGPTTGDTLYVDASYVGQEEGSQEHPFDTIAEALALANDGWAVVLAPGNYDTGGDVLLEHTITLQGAGHDSSFLSDGVGVHVEFSTGLVTVSDLACTSVHSAVTGDTTDLTVAPVLVTRCTLDAVRDTAWQVPDSQSYVLDGCTILGDVQMLYRSCGAPRVIRDCSVTGGVDFKTRSGGECAVSGSVIGGDISLASQVCHGMRLTGSTVGGGFSAAVRTCDFVVVAGNPSIGDGISLTSISADTITVSQNVIANGGIAATHVSVAELTFEGNQLDDGTIVLRCQSAGPYIGGNTVSTSEELSGITVIAVSGPEVSGNTVSVPYVPASRALAEGDTAAVCGIHVRGQAFGPISDNVVTGGTYGIYAETTATEVLGNEVNGSHTGLWGHSADAVYCGNEVSACTGDGLVLLGAGSAFGNLVSGNGGCGVRADGAIDLGGGSTGSLGGNALTGNAAYDLVIETQAVDADTIFAKHNSWDHDVEADVHSYDVWDGNDDSSLSKVAVSPLAEARP